MNNIINWCASDTAGARLTRTIFQGIIGVIIANMDIIAGAAILDPQTRAIVVALVMAVLCPVQKAIGSMDGEQ